MDENYSSSIDYVGWADNECFPDFIWDVMYGVPETDNYYEVSLSTSKLSSDVTSLKRKYADYYDWEAAVMIWRNYMQDLVDRYGSVEAVIDSKNEGTIDDYVPAKPKLKPTKKNKAIIKSGIVPTKSAWELDSEEFKETIEEYIPYDPDRPDTFNEQDMFNKIPHWAKKSISKETQKNAERKRINEAFNGTGYSVGADFISALLNKIQDGDFDFSDKRQSKTPIKDQIEEFELESYRDEDIEAYNDLHSASHMRIQNGGKVVREDDDRAVEFIKDLYELGIDIIGSNKETLGHVRLARQRLGYDDDPAYMTPKQLKKYKKKMKQERKWQNKAKKSGNSVLEKALLNNRRPSFISEDGNNFSVSFEDMFD